MKFVIYLIVSSLLAITTGCGKPVADCGRTFEKTTTFGLAKEGHRRSGPRAISWIFIKELSTGYIGYAYAVTPDKQSSYSLEGRVVSLTLKVNRNTLVTINKPFDDKTKLDTTLFWSREYENLQIGSELRSRIKIARPEIADVNHIEIVSFEATGLSLSNHRLEGCEG